MRTVAIDTRGEAADRPSKPSGQTAKKRTSPALFVLIMGGLVAGIDALLTKGVLAVFGGA